MFDEKYVRQISLPQIGAAGQKKISDAHCVVVGAGGLGCPLLLYLAAAGIGKITIIDNDTVSLSNLHRQILFSQSDIGQSKTEIAAMRLKRIHPNATIIAVKKRLDTKIAEKYVPDADIVIDGTDSFLSKYILSDITEYHHIPFLMGAVAGFSGYMAAFHGGATYRDIFPDPPETAPSCNETGIIGAMAGQIACMMGLETIKIIVDFENTLINKLCRLSSLDYQHKIIDFSSQLPQIRTKLKPISFISEHEIHHYTLIDIREAEELKEKPLLSNAYHVPLSSIKTNLTILNTYKNIALMCHSGRRAERLALLLSLTDQTQHSAIGIFLQADFQINTL